MGQSAILRITGRKGVTVATNVGNDESKRWRKGRGTNEAMEERMDAAYMYILEGGTRRQVTAKIVARFGVSKRTADDDYSRAMGTLQTEQITTKEHLLNQIQALRLVTIQKALKRGQLQTVATLLKDLGAVVGEVQPDYLAQAAAPVLNIAVELPTAPAAGTLPAPEPVDVELLDAQDS